MSALRTILAEAHPSWFGVEPALIEPARQSVVGRRLLARWLLAESAGALLAPMPGDAFGACALRWSRERVARMSRDLGALAFAPAIRAEVRREPVRRLKLALDTSYLLALDRTVWDGKADPVVASRLSRRLDQTLAADPERNDALFALLDHQGRGELRAWALRHDPALADWAMLLRPREDAADAHLPRAPVERVYAHHLARAQQQAA